MLNTAPTFHPLLQQLRGTIAAAHSLQLQRQRTTFPPHSVALRRVPAARKLTRLARNSVYVIPTHPQSQALIPIRYFSDTHLTPLPYTIAREPSGRVLGRARVD